MMLLELRRPPRCRVICSTPRYAAIEGPHARGRQLNRRFGRDTVSFAAAGRRRAWKLRSEFLSPRFTTKWDELLRVS